LALDLKKKSFFFLSPLISLSTLESIRAALAFSLLFYQVGFFKKQAFFLQTRLHYLTLSFSLKHTTI